MLYILTYNTGNVSQLYHEEKSNGGKDGPCESQGEQEGTVDGCVVVDDAGIH